MKIKTKNVEHRKTVLKWLLSKGYLWHSDKYYTPEAIEQEYPFDKWPYISVERSKEISGNNTSRNWTDVVTLPEIEKQIADWNNG